MSLAKQTNITNWNPQNSCIERLMDNAAYTSAHPDDTLVLVGPARKSNATNFSDLTAVGMLQQMQVSQQRAVQPVQAIGSGRNYFLSSKPSVNFSVGRLFAKGPNLHRALYKNIISDANLSGFNPAEPAATDQHPNGVFNMDSELFLIPFGLVVAFRDKAGSNLGSFYIESCMIASYSIGIAAGQNVVMENVNGSADRILPINLSTDIPGVNNFFNISGQGNVVPDENTDLATGSLK
jgi:hypothetical protein